ncbi:MAG: SRPBCC family protein [Candidatus Latescibacterota bacterium]|jgi:uncharacterized protein YndB with AHSA1/START domain
MGQVTASRTIEAPVELVFKTVAHVEEFSKAIPHILNIEFLSDSRTGVGARFRETRLVNEKEATTELEVTEYVENEQVRIVSDTHGTVWDTLFTVRAQNGNTLLEMVMDVRPHSFLARLTTPFITGMIAEAIEGDLDSVKAFCESRAA